MTVQFCLPLLSVLTAKPVSTSSLFEANLNRTNINLRPNLTLKISETFLRYCGGKIRSFGRPRVWTIRWFSNIQDVPFKLVDLQCFRGNNVTFPAFFWPHLSEKP